MKTEARLPEVCLSPRWSADRCGNGRRESRFLLRGDIACDVRVVRAGRGCSLTPPSAFPILNLTVIHKLPRGIGAAKGGIRNRFRFS